MARLQSFKKKKKKKKTHTRKNNLSACFGVLPWRHLLPELLVVLGVLPGPVVRKICGFNYSNQSMIYGMAYELDGGVRRAEELDEKKKLY